MITFSTTWLIKIVLNSKYNFEEIPAGLLWIVSVIADVAIVALIAVNFGQCGG